MHHASAVSRSKKQRGADSWELDHSGVAALNCQIHTERERAVEGAVGVGVIESVQRPERGNEGNYTYGTQ